MTDATKPPAIDAAAVPPRAVSTLYPADVVYLEVGDRPQGDDAIYPDDDVKLETTPNGKRLFTHKDGSPY